jgi:phage terminase small subunit
MFHGNFVAVTKVQPIVETQIVIIDVNVVDVNVTTTNQAIEKHVFKDRKLRKIKSAIDWEKEEQLKKSMVETIQQIQKTQTQPKGPSTSMEGWNTTWSSM